MDTNSSLQARREQAVPRGLFTNLPIYASKAEGAEQIDFGRTDLDNQGLIEFKDRFGTRRTRLTYLRYPESARDESVVASYLPAMRRLFSVLPDALSSTAGGLLYRHIG